MQRSLKEGSVVLVHILFARFPLTSHKFVSRKHLLFFFIASKKVVAAYCFFLLDVCYFSCYHY